MCVWDWLVFFFVGVDFVYTTTVVIVVVEWWYRAFCVLSYRFFVCQFIFFVDEENNQQRIVSE